MSRLLPLAALCLTLPAFAQRPALSVSVDRDRIQVGETVQVKVDVSSARGANVEGPDLDDWQIVGRFQSSSYDSRTRTNVTTIQLTLAPVRAGTLTIPPFKIRDGQTSVESTPLTVSVGGAPGAAPAPGTPTAPPTAPPTAAAPAPADGPPDPDVFLRWEASRTEAWLGAQIVATLYVYTNPRLRVGDFRLSDVNLNGFWTHDQKQRRRRRATRVQLGDRLFTKESVAHYTLFPIRAGELELPPVKATMSKVRGSLFNPRRQAKVERSAEPLKIQVKPLPTANRPNDFAGAVGRVQLSMSADRTRLDASESLQVTVTTTVDGLLQNVPEVELSGVDGFRVFPPSKHENTSEAGGRLRGVRRQVWLLRPTEVGRLKVPAVTLPYFDPAKGRFQRARSGSLDIRVTGTPDPKLTAASESAPVASDGPALRSVRKTVDLTAGDGGRLPAWFALVVVAPPLLFLAWVFRDRVLSQRAAGAGARARRNAARVALRQLDRAASAENGYSAMAKALVGYLDTRLGEPFNGMTRPQLRESLARHGVGTETIDAIVTELENADFARFAPAGDKDEALQATLERARALVRRVEEEVS